jgi:hypothetical protein
MLRPLTTQLVGSYTKPDWLIRHQRVTTPFGDDSFWRPEAEVRQQALDDATLLAIADQERGWTSSPTASSGGSATTPISSASAGSTCRASAGGT